jgi:hypothetical protein
MGTPADIARELPDGTYRMLHVSYDGYLSGVGAQLFKHYSDPEKVDRLFSHSYTPSLEDDPNDFDADGEEWTLYEASDDPANPHKVVSQPVSKEYYDKHLAADISYFWKDGKWFYHRYEYDDNTSHYVSLGFVEITREMLIADDPRTEEYLDDTTPNVPTHIALQQMFENAEANNTNPNVRYFGGHGVYGVSAGIGQFDKEEKKE